MLKRIYNLETLVRPGKVLIVYGPRRSGKTTLLKDYLSKTKLKYKLDSGDNIKTQQILGSQDFSQILEYVSGYDLLAIDEAQYIPNIGMGLKILVDQKPKLKVVVTGSSSFDLAQKTGEPLTGRKRVATLYPFSQVELLEKYNRYELKENLDNFLIFGSYPEAELAKSNKEKAIVLGEIATSYLLKDILSIERIKGPRQLWDLLKLLSFQIGNEVSLNELAAQVQLDVKTINRYLDILEKAFVVKKITGFSRNLRKEASKKAKYYFLDNGVRNAVIDQFNPLDSRDDAGVLFENFLASERIKANTFKNRLGPTYFWRTYDGQEIDWVEERQGKLFGFEFKWSAKSKTKAPKDWGRYKNSQFKVVSKENYLEFLL